MIDCKASIRAECEQAVGVFPCSPCIGCIKEEAEQLGCTGVMLLPGSICEDQRRKEEPTEASASSEEHAF